MTKRQSQRETRPTSIKGPLRFLSSCVFVVALSGCGGEVIEPDYEADEQSGDDGGAGSSGAKQVFSGKCIRCDGQPECGFCLVQIYDNTYVCPPNKKAPGSGCMDLQEQHQTSTGEPFTCYYCD